MSIKKLVDHFNTRARPLKIQIIEVQRQVLRLINGHAIFYCPQKALSKPPVLGMLEQRERKQAYSSETGIDNYIHYRADLDEDLRRLVSCKELIHILDPACYLTNTETDVKSLIIDFASPSALRKTDTRQAQHDRLAVTLAASIFLPLEISKVLLPPYNKGLLSAERIAKSVCIPTNYVERVMSAEWPTFYADALSCAVEEFA